MKALGRSVRFAAPGSEHSLKALLTAVLRPTKPIAEATVLKPEVLPKLAGDKRAEQLERGQGYEDLVPVISVLFLDHRERS